jgi:NFU1 iron-sulfur cluster scaffold homolog, mitochondrial
MIGLHRLSSEPSMTSRGNQDRCQKLPVLSMRVRCPHQQRDTSFVFEAVGIHRRYRHYSSTAAQQIFIQTLDTPNPESLKFVPSGVNILSNQDGNGFYVTNADPQSELLRSPLAKSLLDVEGVKSVYLGSDFVTVTKFAEYKWKLLRPQLLGIVMDWADSGVPALHDEPIITDTTILDDDDEVVAMIKELIEARIRPAVQEDGGDIRYVGFDEETGLVTVQLAGSCVGCPSSSVTLKQGVENMLKHYIPEVKDVMAIDEDGNDALLVKETEANEVSTNISGHEEEESKKQKSYEERLAAAGIPFSN